MNIFVLAERLALGLVFLLFSQPLLAMEVKTPPAHLTKADKNVLSLAMLDSYIRMFNAQVKSGADVDSVLFEGAKNRDEIKQISASLGAAPKITRVGDTIRLQFEKLEMKIRWPDLNSNQVLIEGVSWTFDPSAPMKFQIENLKEKIKTAGRKDDKAALILQIIPEANAAAIIAPIVAACVASSACTWAAVIVGGAIIGNFGGKIAEGVWGLLSEGSCYLAAANGFKPWNTVGWCRVWKTNDDEWAKKMAAQEQDNTDPNTEWVAGDPKCPPKDEKGIELYDAYIGEIRKQANGEWPEQAKWHRFLGKTKDGYLNEGYLFPIGGEASFEKSNEALVQFKYTKDKEPNLYSVSFLDREKGDYIEILATDTATDVKAEYRNENKKMKTMAGALKTWAKTCRTLARAAKIMPRTVEAASKAMQQQEKSDGSGQK